MTTKELPIEFEGTNESIYAGFWLRAGSLLLDLLMVLPIGFLLLYINGLSKNAYYYTVIPILIFGLWYNVYLIKKYGGTPGKLIAGIVVVKINGQDVDWKEAFLRYVITLIFSISATAITIYALMNADENHYTNLGWMEKHKYLVSLAPILFTINSWLTNIWFYSEFIVLLTNKRRRALHDFIAGTVIIKKQYYAEINRRINL